MNAVEIALWLTARNAVMSSHAHRGMHVVTILCLDDPNNRIEVVSEDFERAIAIAQYTYDLPTIERTAMALITNAQGGVYKC